MGKGEGRWGGVGMYRGGFKNLFHKLYIILLCTSYFIMLVVVIKIWAWGENRGPCTMIEGFLGFFTPAFEQEKVCLYMFAHILNRSSILTWFYLYIYTLMRGSWKVFTREAGMGGDNFVCPYLVILLFEFNNSPSSLDPRVIREIQHVERCH